MLAQVFPGLQTAPDAAIIAYVDKALDLSGPAREATAALTANWSNKLIDDIRAIDPGFRFDTLGFPQTLQGHINQLAQLRMERAATYMRSKNDLRPLQVETLRFVQERTDFHYKTGLARFAHRAACSTADRCISAW